jgi:PhzF family phenazine biosynthesis protein
MNSDDRDDRPRPLRAKLVDVFTDNRLSGNGLGVFYPSGSLTTQQMMALTREMRQFESVFTWLEEDAWHARIFTAEEELDFAGHPLIGLAAHLHEECGDDSPQRWRIRLNRRDVIIDSSKTESYYEATMNQGKAEFIRQLEREDVGVFLQALNLSSRHLSGHPLQVVSTGLPYLIVPLRSGIENARIRVDNFEELLSAQGARFVYLLDVERFEGRTWDNSGRVEDIATGSAAGPAGAFLHRNGLVKGNLWFVIRQGRFMLRPSEIGVQVRERNGKAGDILVNGRVCKVANIELV